MCFCLLSSLHQLAYKNKICKIVGLFSRVYLCIGKFSSATSRHVLVLFERYGHRKKMGPKNFEYIFLIHILWEKLTKWSTNTLVTKIFSRETNLLPQRHQILNIFGPSATTMWGFMCHYIIHTRLRKWYAQKTSGWHSSETDYERLLKRRESKGDCLKNGDKYPPQTIDYICSN